MLVLELDLFIAEVYFVFIYNKLWQLQRIGRTRVLSRLFFETPLSGHIRVLIALERGIVVIIRAHRHGHVVLATIFLDVSFEAPGIASTSV